MVQGSVREATFLPPPTNRPDARPFHFSIPAQQSSSPLPPQRMDQPRRHRGRQRLVADVETLGRHDVQSDFLGRFRAAGEGFLAQLHQLAAGEHAVRVEVGRGSARLAARFELSDAGVDVRQIGAGLGDALFVLSDRTYDFGALGLERGDGANFGHSLNLGGSRHLFFWRLRRDTGKSRSRLARRSSVTAATSPSRWPRSPFQGICSPTSCG